MRQPAARIQVLDLIRGVAVLGIVTVNVFGFAGPSTLLHNPEALGRLPTGPASAAGEAVHSAMLVLFEGKMRALFSMLFGASLLLFIERAEASGGDGALRQIRRLFWLGLIGYLHFALLWRGDILFTYACAGAISLALQRLATPGLLAAALFAFTAWQGAEIARHMPTIHAEAHMTQGTASDGERERLIRRQAMLDSRSRAEMAELRMPLPDQIRARLVGDPAYPLRVMWYSLGETVPFMLLGMVLLRTGFFTGGWNTRRLKIMALAGLGLGGAATIAFTLWARQHGYPDGTMQAMIMYGLGYPHLLMAMSYAALLALAAPALLGTRAGQGLAAAGRMALSNYIGTSLLLGLLFMGWGMGLAGRVPVQALPLAVLTAWAAMLGLSAPWLARFRQGPLEWLWRSLTEWRMMRFKR